MCPESVYAYLLQRLFRLLQPLCWALALLSPQWSQAGTIAGTGGATEWTQVLNYGELVHSGALQAQAVANQITAQITRAQELVNSYQNLKNAPAEIIAQTIAPYQTMIASSQQLLNSVTGVYSSYNQAAQMIQARTVEARTLGTNPQQYLTLEARLSAQKGGIYQAAYQHDTQTLQNVVSKSEALQNMTSNIPSTGTVQGLDKLNALTAMVAGETIALNQEMAAASAQRNQEKMDQLNASANQAKATQQYSQELLDAQQKALQAAQQPSGYHQQQIRQNAYKTFTP